jgi:hypothetical protein
MPCIILFNIGSIESFLLLQNNIVFIPHTYNTIIKFREIGFNDKIKEISFTKIESCLKAFNFLMELMKTNPPMIVDTKYLTEDTDNYIDNFYQKKNN